MSKRLRIVLLSLGLAGIGLAVWFVVALREPEYQGRNLSAWLRELETRQNDGSANAKEATDAIRHIGVQGLPVLLRKIKSRDARWKVDAVDTVQSALNLDLNESLSTVHRQRATLGFHVLGRIAEPAIPKLTALTTHPDLQTADAAFHALTEIGGPNIIPPLLNALTNGNVNLRALAAFSLGSLRSKARSAVPALAQALREQDIGLQSNAARALRDIGMDGDIAIPALVHALTNADPRIYGWAASALGVYGTQAEFTLPLLHAMPKGPDEIANRSVARATVRVQCEMYDGGIIRGPKAEKRLAFVFTGHEYAEGGPTILDELDRHHGKGSFFLTGVFLSKPEFRPLLQRVITNGHFLGPHSDQHLLYCAWEPKKPTLVTKDEFTQDLMANMAKIGDLGAEERRFSRYFLPAFEHYNRDIVDWSREQRRTVINYTPGTRSNGDYTGEADKNFIPTQVIFDSIVKKEREDPHGLNGFILLLHIGTGPGRTDKFHYRFGELLDYLAAKGYQFIRVDELLEAKSERTNEPVTRPDFSTNQPPRGDPFPNRRQGFRRPR